MTESTSTKTAEWYTIVQRGPIRDDGLATTARSGRFDTPEEAFNMIDHYPEAFTAECWERTFVARVTQVLLTEEVEVARP